MKRLLVFCTAVFSLWAGWLMAQPVVQNAVSGLECWNAGQGPGGTTTGFLCTYLVRNGQAMTVVSSSATASTTSLSTQQATIFWSGTAPTTWQITLPPSPFDGEQVSIGTDTTLTALVTLTPAPVPGSTTVTTTLSPTFASATITSATGVEFQYSLPKNAWYRTR